MSSFLTPNTDPLFRYVMLVWSKAMMAEGEELTTNNELTIRSIRAFCGQLQLTREDKGASFLTTLAATTQE
jgi:hypothetical protein